MNPCDVVIGNVYVHALDGRDWLVTVTGVENEEWEGTLSGDQRGLSDGSPVWGYVNQLREE